MVPMLEGIILSGMVQQIDGAHSFLIRLRKATTVRRVSVAVRKSSGQALGRDRTIAPAAARASVAG